MSPTQIVILVIIAICSPLAAAEYHCDANKTCIVNCVTSTTCNDQSIYCPFNHDCIINCQIPGGCRNTIIHAENSTYLSITVQAEAENAKNMKIYAPNPNIMKRTSTITCHSDITGLDDTKLDQCKDITIYSRRGFKDIDLKCNTNNDECDISGSVNCGYDEDYLYDKCMSFEYDDVKFVYQCQDHDFCQFPTNNPTQSPTRSISPVFQQEYKYSTSAASIEKEQGIATFYIVIFSTLGILCLILTTLTVCGFVYARLNRESVEETIVKRYISGRGRGASIDIKPHYGKEDESCNGSKLGSDRIIYGDMGSDNASSFDHDDLHKILDMDLNTSPGGSDQSSFGLGLTATSPLGIVDNNKINDNKSSIYHIASEQEYGNMHEFEDELENIQNVLTDEMIIANMNDNMVNDDRDQHSMSNGQSSSCSTYVGECEDSFDFHREEMKINKEMGLITYNDGNRTSLSSNSSGYKVIFMDTNELDTNESHDIHCNLPHPPKHIYIESIMELTEKQKKIQLENIKNRSKCFGYQQNDILFEDDENYSDDSSNELNDTIQDKKKILVIDNKKTIDCNKNNDENGIYLKVITQRDHSDFQTSVSNSRSMARKLSQSALSTLSALSVSDDLLEDGNIIQITNDENNDNMNEIDITPMSPTPISPCSLLSEIKDPEILSDDEELPTLPTNSPKKQKITFGHKLNVNVVDGWK